ncbi:MAG: rubrerythrin family protein [Alistipes sp.]|nr:rubrerythrin family protein [Paludibacteraceae bacterium]MBO5831867.1 rubrerythrin family protein [Alistipes sp.]
MKDRLKGTLTEENLLKAFAGESQARNRYTFFAKQAKKDGYEQIAAVFLTTAEQEMEHAKRFFKYLEGGMATIHNASYPAGIISTTADNLIAAAEGEHDEWANLYASFAETAHAEGFQKVALTFKHVAEVEKEHERRYLKLLSRLADGDFFRRDGEIVWQCRNCGYIVKASKAPKLCPSCEHEQRYFEPMADNY